MANKFQRRARRRLARVRLADPNSLPGVAPGPKGRFSRHERYAILGAARKLNTKERLARNKPKKPTPYNPLLPLSGKSMEEELAAQERLQFGPQESALAHEQERQKTATDTVASGYDQYRQALIDATARVNAENERLARESQQHVDTAYQQDVASAQTEEGKQAAAGARSQGNQSVTGLRTQAAADNTYLENRGATAVQAKAETLNRRDDRRRELDDLGRQLAQQKGDFRVTQRGKLRGDERTYALARKEFGLKEKELQNKTTGAAADRKLERQKLNAQKIVAKIYASADRAGAKAQIRVAKIQLRKGKIDQKQYRRIVNIYKGLPEKGQPGGGGKPGKPGKRPMGSGPGGSLAPWEVDARQRALNGFQTNQYGPEDKARAISKAVQAGIPERLARAAWRRYAKTLRNSATAEAPERAPRGAHGRI